MNRPKILLTWRHVLAYFGPVLIVLVLLGLFTFMGLLQR
jgi:hypothetical protein